MLFGLFLVICLAIYASWLGIKQISEGMKNKKSLKIATGAIVFLLPIFALFYLGQIVWIVANAPEADF